MESTFTRDVIPTAVIFCTPGTENISTKADTLTVEIYFTPLMGSIYIQDVTPIVVIFYTHLTEHIYTKAGTPIVETSL
jgi:hypothetical protein